MTAPAPAPEELGLRERKRRATRRAIQLAVIDLVAEHGLDGTTVDEISRRADISPRTFFNYFASKEDAIIGELPPLPSEELVERFVSAGRGASLFDGLSEILVETVEGEGHDQELMQRRKSVLQQHPHLFAMRIARMRRLEDEMGRIVARRLVADDPRMEEGTAERRGHLVANVAFAAMRHAWGCWAQGDHDSRLGDHVAASFTELKSVFSSDAA
ncbi:TetR/AcrR family transcriptional regulator [Schumannella luteola]